VALDRYPLFMELMRKPGETVIIRPGGHPTQRHQNGDDQAMTAAKPIIKFDSTGTKPRSSKIPFPIHRILTISIVGRSFDGYV